MSQQVRVERALVFAGDANQEKNVFGNFAENKIHVSYHYTELALNNTNNYTPYLDTDSVVALANGGISLTTLATDTRVCSQAQGGIWWYPAKNPVVEMRFKIDVITSVAIYAGFTDATVENTTLLPQAIVDGAQTATAANSAGFLFDTRQTLNYFNIVSSHETGAAKAFTQLASNYVPVAATFLNLRVAIDTAGNAYYYWNGVLVGYKALACHPTTRQVPYFGIRNNAATAHVATLRRVDLWCDD